MKKSNSDITQLLNDLASGDLRSKDEVYKRVYGRLKLIAEGGASNHSADNILTPTVLVHEAFIKVFGDTDTAWANRNHFFSVTAKAMRHIAIDHARMQSSLKRGGGWKKLQLDPDTMATDSNLVDITELEAALQELEGLNSRHAQIIEMRFFGGMTTQETASVLNVSPRTVELNWRAAKAWLQVRLKDEL